MWFVPCFLPTLMFQCINVNSFRMLQQRQSANTSKLNHFHPSLSLKTEADGWGAEDDLNWEDESTW